MFEIFKPSNPPTFGDVIWKLLVRVVVGFGMIIMGVYVFWFVLMLIPLIIKGIFGLQ